MKAIAELNNVEKGKLFADLFPGEIDGVLDAIIKMTNMMTECKDEIVSNWNNGFIGVEFWYRLANEVRSIVDQDRNRLLKPRLFANKLFDGYLALFTIDCIMKHVEKEKKDTKYWHLANALFNYH